MKHWVPVVFVLIFLIIGCNSIKENAVEKTDEPKNNEKNPVEVVSMKLTSPAFRHNGDMPPEYTCDGSNVLPELNIENVPEKAKSLALIMDDPDAPSGTWVHWVVWNIPPTAKKIEKGAEPQGMQGKTSFGRPRYGGPCPPSGVHRYFFKLYALDTILSIKEGSNKSDLEQAMQGHIIEKTELMGTYKRK